MSGFPGILRACREIAYDNGGINRFRSENKQAHEFERWLAKQPAEMLPPISAWLAALSDDDLTAVCCGEESEGLQVLATAPPFTNDLLNSYFEEVC